MINILTFALTNCDKLVAWGGALPNGQITIPPGQKVEFSVLYSGLLPSETENDIVATAEFTSFGDDEDTICVTSRLTSVRVELEAVYEAPENINVNRHMYGVGEKVRLKVRPRLQSISLTTQKHDADDCVGDYELFDVGGVAVSGDEDHIYVCPISATFLPEIWIQFGRVRYCPEMRLIEPNEVITTGAFWGENIVDIFYSGNRYCWPRGEVGSAALVTTNYIGPMCVSFQGIAVAEIPCIEEDVVTGCFTNGHLRTHVKLAGAGIAHYIEKGNFWFVDAVRSGDAEVNWIPNSTMNWKNPIGWYRQRRDATEWYGVDAPANEYYDDDKSRQLIIPDNDNYTMKRHIDEDGTYRTEKFGHWISRSRWCHVILDGITKQWIHLL